MLNREFCVFSITEKFFFVLTAIGLRANEGNIFCSWSLKKFGGPHQQKGGNKFTMQKKELFLCVDCHFSMC